MAASNGRWGLCLQIHETLNEQRDGLLALANGGFVGYTLTMKLSVTIDRDECVVWVIECPAIPGCLSHGKTKPEALKNIKEAIALCLEVRAERGMPLFSS